MNLIVRKIERKLTDEWLLKKHYARRLTSISYAFGLYNDGALIGICTFGSALPMQMKRGVCGKEYENIVYELNRLCVNDDHPKNATSFLVSQSLKMLPRPMIIISYADGAMQHTGFIYQATNFIYVGISHIQKDWRVKDSSLHPRALIDQAGRGKDRIKKLKEIYGDKLYQVERPPKHKYIYFLGSKVEKKRMLNALKYKIKSYPKTPTKRYLADYKVKTLF